MTGRVKRDGTVALLEERKRSKQPLTASRLQWMIPLVAVFEGLKAPQGSPLGGDALRARHLTIPPKGIALWKPET